MRPLQEWDETDLQKLIDDQLQESLQLDYKQSDALAKTSTCQTEIAKDVSAFANSSGGRIIYGITEANHLPVSIDAGADPSAITREWIENTIISRVQPRITGIVIKAIPLSAGGNAYVIDIPQATTFAPHQAGHRYYRRYNFQSVPMEDYEVKDTMRRASASEPYIRFSIRVLEKADGTKRAALSAHISNRSSEPMLYGTIKIFFAHTLFKDARPDINEWKSTSILVQLGDGSDWVPIHQYHRNHGIPGKMPIFKEMEFSLFELDISVPDIGHYFLGYAIACPGYSCSIGANFFFDGIKLTAINEENASMVRA